MPAMVRLTVLLLFTAVLLTACQDERKTTEARPVDLNAVQDCFSARQYDSLAVSQDLRGEWQWLHRGYGMVSAPLDDRTDAGLVINFISDSVVVVDRSGVGMDSVPYSISSSGDYRFAFQIDTEVPELGGQVTLCENILVASRAYIDGLTDVFLRPD